MGEENIVLGMEIYMWEGFIKEWDMGEVDIDGKIKVDIKDNGFKIKCMGMEHSWQFKDKLFKECFNMIIILDQPKKYE